jgi:hypothetical protein
MYQVLSTRPITERTGEKSQARDAEGNIRTVHWEEVTTWPILGMAKDYDEARAKFGGRPVLQWIGKHTH